MTSLSMQVPVSQTSVVPAFLYGSIVNHPKPCGKSIDVNLPIVRVLVLSFVS